MKKLIPIITLIVLTASSCKEVDKLTMFNLTFNNQVTIPASTGLNLPFNITTPDITTNSSSQFENNNTNKDLIEEINLTTFEMSVTSPIGEDFSFLKSITVFIKAPGQDEVRMAWNENIPDDAGAVLNLETTDADLKAYMISDSFTLRVNATTDEALANDHDLNIRTVYKVDAKILGQ